MSKFDKFQYVNKPRRVNRVIQVVLAVTLVLMLNYLGTGHYVRSDITPGSIYSLSSETKGHIQSLDLENPVKIYVTLLPEGERGFEQRLYKYVRDLLKEFEYHGREGDRKRVEVEFINMLREPVKAEQFRQKYNLPNSNIVLIDAGGVTSVLTAEDLMEVRNQKLVAFKAERAITTELIKVSSDEAPTIYFTVGHGEMQASSSERVRGLSTLASDLGYRNYDVQQLDLIRQPKVPDDADLVVVAGPQGPFHPEAVEKLRRYLSKQAGKVVILVGPGVDHGLDPLLADWRIGVPDAYVVDLAPGSHMQGGGLLINRFGSVGDTEKPHPIAAFLVDNQVPVLLGMTRPVVEAGHARPDPRLSVSLLMAASEKSWGETSGTTLQPDENDFPGPVPVAVVAERKAISEADQITISGGRLAVFGNADFIDNQHIAYTGNLKIFLNTVNWMLDKEKLLPIAPRPLNQFTISMDVPTYFRMGGVMFLVPLAMLAGAIVVYFRRRA